MDAVSQESRRDIASSIMVAWGLDAQQRKRLLDDPETVIGVLSIHESLRVIYSEAPDRALQWPAKPNREFNGRTAIDLILNGDIEKVRKYLKYHVYNA
jgi:Antitoxin Xre/MbcA/ParS C-terminal toxin-binding domain